MLIHAVNHKGNLSSKLCADTSAWDQKEKKKKKKEFCNSAQRPLKSFLHLLRSRARGVLIFCLKSIIYKLPELRRAGESTKASPKDDAYCRVPGLTHFSYPARERNGSRSCQGPALPAVPRGERAQRARGSPSAAAAPSSVKVLGKQLCHEHRTLSCLWFTGRSVRHGLVCLSLLYSPPGSSDNERDELLLAERREKCALLASLYPCPERERANSYIILESSAI